MTTRPDLVQVEDVRKVYGGSRSMQVAAVDGVSIRIGSGDTYGLVGESGSGKSTISRLILGLEAPTSGRVIYDGIDTAHAHGAAARRLRRELQIVFQDPVAALNRRKTVQQIVGAPLAVHRVGVRAERRNRVLELLDLVGLDDSLVHRHPSSLSGGQCQRVSIARALALEPRFVILDEAVSAVDVSIRAQILNLLRDLQARLGLTYLFISHDLAVVRVVARRVAVMYLGRVVEEASRDELFAAPRHPYTAALLDAIPEPGRRTHIFVPDVDLADPNQQTGCTFRPRCPIGHARELCRTAAPPLAEVEPGRWSACHFADEVDGLAAVRAKSEVPS